MFYGLEVRLLHDGRRFSVFNGTSSLIYEMTEELLTDQKHPASYYVSYRNDL